MSIQEATRVQLHNLQKVYGSNQIEILSVRDDLKLGKVFTITVNKK